MHLTFNSRQFLYVMPQFVCENISLRKLARRSEPPIQLIEKAQINVNLFILRTIEGTRGGPCAAASGLSVIAEKHQLGVSIAGTSLLWQKLRPRVLRVIEYERHELY